MPIVARLRLPASAVIVVAKYARVSTGEQLDGFGLEDQKRVFDGWLARHPEATVYDEYVDEAASGALESRPEMDRLAHDARRGCFNRILVPAVDRIGRTARAAYQWAWDMADLGVHFLSASEDIDTSTEAGLKVMEQELEEYRRQKDVAEQWLRTQADRRRQAGRLAALASNARESLDNMTPDERKELCDFLDVRVAPWAMGQAARSGIRCEVREWHHETGTLVPPDPTGEEWEAVLAMLRGFFPEKSKKHFISKYDIRAQLSGMLHRLRSGLSWVEMPLTWGPINPMRERQLFWWKRGAWPEIMAVLGADRRGVEEYRRSMLPQLTVTVRLREGLPPQGRREALDARPAL